MSKDAETGRVVANAVELGKAIMEQVSCESIRAPQGDRLETLAAKIVNNMSKRAVA